MNNVLKKRKKLVILNIKLKEKKHKQLYYKLQFMKLNATRKQLIKNIKKQQKFRQNVKNIYYTCDKLKHYFRKCIQNQYKKQLSFYDKKK